jgi:hypothetical protein
MGFCIEYLKFAIDGSHFIKINNGRRNEVFKFAEFNKITQET